MPATVPPPSHATSSRSGYAVDADSRRRHDRLNVPALSVLVALTFTSAALPSPATHALLSYAALLYTTADIAYHVAHPRCQPNVVRFATILLHHAAAAVLLLHSVTYPAHGGWTWRCTLLEVNTFLLEVRRVSGSKNPALRIGFYVTWIGMRLVYCPCLLVTFHREMIRAGFDEGGWTYVRVMWSHALICGLNYFWTFEMAHKRIMDSKGKEK